MKCKHCDGDGVIVDVEYGHADKYMCDYCWGTGVVEPLTEQEYLQTCNTEQLIRFLLWYPQNVFGYPKPKMSIADEEDAIREWLKKPHT